MRPRSLHRFGEMPQQRRAVAAPRAAVHAGERASAARRPAARARRGVGRMREVVHRLRGTPRSGRGCRRSVSAVSPVPGCVNRSPQKKVFVCRLHHQPALPAVRHVRRVEPLHRVAAERERLAVGEARAGRSARSLIDTIAAIGAAQRHGLRRDGEELVQRAAFVGLDVRQPDVAQRSTGMTRPIASLTSGNSCAARCGRAAARRRRPGTG